MQRHVLTNQEQQTNRQGWTEIVRELAQDGAHSLPYAVTSRCPRGTLPAYAYLEEGQTIGIFSRCEKAIAKLAKTTSEWGSWGVHVARASYWLISDAVCRRFQANAALGGDGFLIWTSANCARTTRRDADNFHLACELCDIVSLIPFVIFCFRLSRETVDANRNVGTSFTWCRWRRGSWHCARIVVQR